MKNQVMLCTLTIAISACAALKGPPGPKLYDNVVLITKNENALILPPTTDKEFVRVVRNRLDDAAKREIQNQGDLKMVDTCAPRTLMVTQDITGVTLSGEAYSTGGLNPFRPTVTTTKKDDVRISTALAIADCETGKELASYTYWNNAPDPTSVISWISEWNIGYVYQHQRGPRANNQ